MDKESSAKSAAVFSKFLDKSEYKMVVKIAEYELEKLVEEFFGHKEYEMVVQEEWNNDSSHEFNLDGNHYEWDSDKIKAAYCGKWKNTNLRVMLNEMCKRGALPKCQMIVRVSW